MAWEERNGRMYYYRKKRIGKRVVSEYFGSGALAEALAVLDAEDRKHAKMKRQEWKKVKKEVKVINQEMDKAERLVRSLLRANMLLSGFHPHKGMWRKRRN